MLRLTTNVTVSPASSARSSSAAWRMSSIASGRVSANSAVSSSGDSHSPSRPLAIAPGTASRAIVALLAPARAAPRDEGPVLQLDQRRARPARATRRPCTAGRRTAARSARSPPARAACACGARDGNGCSGEMWSPLADRPPRSVAPSSTSGSHQSERFGGIWTPTSGISSRDARTSTRMSSSVISFAQLGSGRPRRAAVAVLALGGVRDLAPARRRSSADAGRSSAGSPPAGGRARGAPPPAPRAPRSAPAATRRCRPGCRS